MSLDDFTAGFYRAVLSRAESVGIVKEDLPTLVRTKCETALTTFYTTNSALIESAPGVAGMTMVSVSFQCGFEFGRLMMGILFLGAPVVASETEWGPVLAAALTDAATTLAPLKIRRGSDGIVTVTEKTRGSSLAGGNGR